MDVSRHHRQRDVAFESANAMIRTAVKAMHFEGVDGGLDCRVLTSRFDEILGVLRFLRLLR